MPHSVRPALAQRRRLWDRWFRVVAESNHLVALEQARADARERIGEGYANDLIDADDLDRRLDALEHAATRADIAALLDDLPRR